MCRGPNELNSADVRQAAALHLVCLPDSIVSRLGRRYAESFYRFIQRSPDEHVFVERDGDRILSVCVLSRSPDTLDRRLLRGTFLLCWLPLRLFHLPLRQMIVGRFRRGSDEDATQRQTVTDDAPEVVIIFSDPAARGRGLGRKLLVRCERFLAGQGYHRYVLRTLADEANRAIKFYEDNGFNLVCRLEKRGKRYCFFEKHGFAAAAEQTPVEGMSE